MDYQNNGYQQGGYQAPQNGYGGYAQQPAPAQGGGLGWNDDFAAEEGSRNPLLPEGDYWFEIVKLERGRHNGSAKTPPCNKAIVTFRILAPQGEAIITENYFVVDIDWARQKNTSLFASIGIAKKGEARVKPVWSNEIAGRRGVCHIAPRSFEKDGKTHQTNDLKYLYPQWDQPNMEPVAPQAVPTSNSAAPQTYGSPQYAPPVQQQYQQPAQGYAPQQPVSNQGYAPQQGGYQQTNNGYGGGIY